MTELILKGMMEENVETLLTRAGYMLEAFNLLEPLTEGIPVDVKVDNDVFCDYVAEKYKCKNIIITGHNISEKFISVYVCVKYICTKYSAKEDGSGYKYSRKDGEYKYPVDVTEEINVEVFDSTPGITIVRI